MMGLGSGGVQTKTRLPKGTPEYRNQPLASAPGLLRVIAGLSIFSVVGVLMYGVAISLGDTGWPGASSEPEKLAYVAILHLLLPICVAYTVVMNHSVSRLLIAIYAIVLCSATIAGKGALAALPLSIEARTIVFTGVLVVTILWLFRAPSMRVYYALIGNKPIPDDLRDRAEELAARNWIHPRVKAIVDWTVDHLETVVLLGFVVVVLYAFYSTTN